MKKFLLLSLLSFYGNLLLGDIAPPPKRTNDQIRRDEKRDDCKERKKGDACLNMKGEKGRCDWFTWWWIPNSEERGIENGKMEYTSYYTRCDTIDKKIKRDGKSETVKAYKCLVCK